jgi:hypothetical protein
MGQATLCHRERGSAANIPELQPILRGTHLVPVAVVMTHSTRTAARVLVLATLFTSPFLGGCVGKTVGGGESTDGGGGSSGGGSGGGGSSGSGGGSGGGGSCVDIVLSSYDLSCQQDSDCISISSGQICDGDCTCGGSTINADGESRYKQALSSLTLGECACPLECVPQCLGNVCTICTGAPSDPPACQTKTVQADSGICVNVDLSTYDTSCQTSADCTDITSGTLCTGYCACGGSAINSSGLARYENAVAPLGNQTECPCPASPPIACVGGTCTVCGYGQNQPEGCPDGGF